MHKRQGSRPFPKEKKKKKKTEKRQNDCLRRPYKWLRKKRSKRQRRKGKIHPFECRVPKNNKKR